MTNIRNRDELIEEVSRAAGRAVFTVWWGFVLYALGMLIVHWI